eukprot:m.199999 g.199999  ORF g.199999 m.199999 type:complete len:183 (-) comp15327_c0_seq2:37-585(-)
MHRRRQKLQLFTPNWPTFARGVRTPNEKLLLPKELSLYVPLLLRHNLFVLTPRFAQDLETALGASKNAKRATERALQQAQQNYEETLAKISEMKREQIARALEEQQKLQAELRRAQEELSKTNAEKLQLSSSNDEVSAAQKREHNSLSRKLADALQVETELRAKVQLHPLTHPVSCLFNSSI